MLTSPAPALSTKQHQLLYVNSRSAACPVLAQLLRDWFIKHVKTLGGQGTATGADGGQRHQARSHRRGGAGYKTQDKGDSVSYDCAAALRPVDQACQHTGWPMHSTGRGQHALCLGTPGLPVHTLTLLQVKWHGHKRLMYNVKCCAYSLIFACRPAPRQQQGPRARLCPAHHLPCSILH